MSDIRDRTVEYIVERFAKEDFILNNILAKQEEDQGPMMNVGPDQGKFLNLIIKLLKPHNVLEVGSYYGYSSVWMGRAIHDLNNSQNTKNHKLSCIEVSKPNVDIINEHLNQAGLENDVEVFHGSGIDTMQKFVDESRKFEMIFIDADKVNYSNYMDLATKLLPHNGLLLVDNTIWDGKVLDLEIQDKQTNAIQAFNEKLAASNEYESTIATIQDGLAFAIKK